MLASGVKLSSSSLLGAKGNVTNIKTKNVQSQMKPRSSKFAFRGLFQAQTYANFQNTSSSTKSFSFPKNNFNSHGFRFFASGSYPDHTVLELPALSPTMETGTITKWAVKVGDKVTGGTNLAKIETDKSTMDWDSVDDGYVAKLLFPDGASDVKVGTPVAILANTAKDVSAFEGYESEASPAAAPKEQPKQEAPSTPQQTQQPKEQPKQAAPSAPSSTGRVFASPAAKAVAAASGINLSEVQGTGPNSRIIKADVLEFAPSQPQKQQQQQQQVQLSSGANYTDIPNSNVRKVTASRLTQSKQTIPHYYLSVDFSVDKLQALRNELNGLSKDYKLSVNDFVIKAAAKALRAVPEVNSQWNETSIRRFHDIHINVAVNTDNGLFTPIVRYTDRIGLRDINTSVKEAAEKAHAGKLGVNDLEIGTFTISNLGMFGIKNFSAVINPPQACILAVGGIEQRVVVRDNRKEGDSEFKVSNFMSVTLSCDHRVVDGALGATWLKAFKGYMENPVTLLL